ncbi:DeoR faimly transcriptional regulator [Pseudomonas amygdali pv. tabaci str. ATCC 11528]|uniref:diguanylate cyclase n=2 Tax=Pseudomonas amygdali pv. lachrymans TaxID=53707 RepID=A0AB37R6C0_PSEAV|nr:MULTISPECIES: GGDEF domain-containing protein [Pseudomonas syringae group genomosp. 2]ARA78845.1 GGDEF domain-containing protein [Pseudomonas amygdali pv. lachrymans]AXH58572.1 GGDEF domain-containing protein [Pseudomonas amygdali pv. lachrymans str. M301315]KEZ71038.1 DeoR faimly transcriptional regulator [Pseudomonas amygdali pv. tabaci str. ATCC 11528]KKY53487.1 DeoR faimly transcriptional regulator [Pseudomonas amygdali pv. tabaci str. ATCC 11528]KKY57905.1 DeoR faimly transcriptional r
MSDDAERWKEKYLKGIEQQDKLEKRWDARLDLLRRGLVRSSLAAEGSDRAVDECMKEMREIVRKDDMDAGLAALIPRLEKAVLDSEHRREVRVGQIGSALTALVAQLQALPLPREVRKPLKRFAKDLEERASQARELPLLLSELSGLQGQALTLLEKHEEGPRQGLLQRLFGSRDEHGNERPPEAAHPENAPSAQETHETHVQPEAANAQAPIDVAAAEVEAAIAPDIVNQKTKDAHTLPPQVSEAETAIVTAPETPVPSPAAAALAPALAETVTEPAVVPVEPIDYTDLLGPVPSVPYQQRPVPIIQALEQPQEDAESETETVEGEEGYSLPSSPEPSYSSVAAHIEETLLGLLDDLTLSEHFRPQVEDMQLRLKHGLNWYELLPILDDLAVLMLAINNGGQQEFSTYLKQLNERLESFQSHLQAASEDHAEDQSTARDLNEQLREQVGGLQISVQDASDLTSLKQVLDNRFEGLLSTMDHYQLKRDAREREVASRLQGLSARVASMEQEALGFRTHLEEQRQKALIDPLTGLPNRAAWGERLEQEMTRWQHEKNSLLVCILDLDHFKRINDGYGHLAGDKVLKIVANVFRKRLRSDDFLARFGGEEFVMLLPATPPGTGLTLLDELRAAVESCPFHFKGERVTITVSIGVTAFRTAERSDTAIKRADQALYKAKENGRNRVEQG